MKIFIFIILTSTSLQAAECKLLGTLESLQNIETTVSTQNFDECKMMGVKTLNEKFFGLVSQDDSLIETKVTFKSEEGSRSEVIQPEPSDDSI